MRFIHLLKYLGYEKNRTLDFLLDYFDKRKCVLDLLERFLINEKPSIRFYQNEEGGITFFDEENVGKVNYSWKESDWIEFSDDESRIDEDSYLLYQRVKPLLEKFYDDIYEQFFGN